VALRSYLEGGQRRFAVVMVPRGGASWQWFAGLDGAEVGEKLAQPGAWLVDLDVVLDGDRPAFSVVINHRG
jgi:hypothetical protein